MASGNKGREQAQEDALRRSAAEAAAKSEAAVAAAAAPDPLEELRRKRVTEVEEWDQGLRGPKDIRNLPGGDTAIALFNDAKQARDEGRIGRGYGMLADGANPNYVASLDRQNQLERDLEASGALESHVEDILTGNKAELYGLSGLADARNMNIANLRASASESAQDRSLQYLMRPKQPSFLRQLALAAVGAAGQVGAGYATGGLAARRGGG